MSGSCSQYSMKSLPERSALSPIETNEESPIPRAAASSMAAMPNAPLWEAKATLPGVGSPGANVALSAPLVVQVRDAEAVRADDAHAGRPADGEQLVLARAALGPDLCEARGEDDERAHAVVGTLARRLDDRSGRHGDDRQLHVLLDLGDRADGRSPCDLAALRVDEVQRAGVAGREQVAHDLAADGAGAAGRADDRDRGGPQHVGDRGDVSGALAFLEAFARLGRQRGRELDLHAAVDAAHRRREARVLEDLQHAVVLGQHNRPEGLDFG